jgi:trimeric autotransporter adhesin
VHADGLDFIAPIGTGSAGALDGNLSANRVTISYTINGISIPNGSNFSIRWTDFDVTGAEDGLGIDDFSITLGCTPPTNQPTGLNLTPALQSIDGSFTAALAGTTPADAYVVLMSASPTLTELPVSGTAYAVDDAIGNAQVVSITGTTFTASGLTPSTTYYFFVFSNSSATNCYNITNPLTGNATTNAPPPCTAPSTQASNLNATNITGTSMDLTWTRGNGDNILVIARPNAPVDATIYNSLSYPQGTQIGSNTVIFNGNAAAFNYTGLAQNTTYHFALYEYSNTGPCYLSPALTGNFTTLCTNPEK